MHENYIHTINRMLNAEDPTDEQAEQTKEKKERKKSQREIFYMGTFKKSSDKKTKQKKKGKY